MRAADLAPAARHRREDAGPCHIVEASAHPGERLANDPQELPGLLVDVPLANSRAVIGVWRAAADFDRRTTPDLARLAGDGFPLAGGGEDATWRHGDHARRSRQTATAIRPKRSISPRTSSRRSFHWAPAWVIDTRTFPKRTYRIDRNCDSSRRSSPFQPAGRRITSQSPSVSTAATPAARASSLTRKA